MGRSRIGKGAPGHDTVRLAAIVGLAVVIAVGSASPLWAGLASRTAAAGASVPPTRSTTTVADPHPRGFFELPDSETILRVGGYLKLDLLLDPKPVGDADDFVAAGIPITVDQGANRGASTTLSIRQSRLNLVTRRPTRHGPLRLFYESDFLAAGGATNFHLRHASCQVGKLLIGRSFTTLEDVDAYPETLDIEGPTSVVSLRQLQVRWTVDVGRGNTLAVAAEIPDSDITTPDHQATPVHRIPDWIVRARWDRAFGHLQLGTVLRQLGYDDGRGRRDTAPGCGLVLSGLVKTHAKGQLQFQLGYGEGYARYLNDLTGLGLDAVVRPTGELEPLPVLAPVVAYLHRWSRVLRSSLVYSRLEVRNAPSQPASAIHRTQYAALNLIRKIGAFDAGVEALYGTHAQHDGRRADAFRVQLSAQVNLFD
ncbi:MAG: porin [Candidatus Riflebacteria bacterium]|nr:porin [Candidatus Riflebacteria bacterium]